MDLDSAVALREPFIDVAEPAAAPVSDGTPPHLKLIIAETRPDLNFTYLPFWAGVHGGGVMGSGALTGHHLPCPLTLKKR